MLVQTDISRELLIRKVNRQLEYVAGLEETGKIERYIDKALLTMEESLRFCRIKQARTANGEAQFRTRHTGQYAMFLWFLSRAAYEDGDAELAEDISYVNSSLNSIFLNHRVDMPRHFYFDHPLGTVIGRAQIGDYFFCAQGCTVGAVEKGGALLWPQLGGHVEMMSGSSVIGNCKIGDYVIFSSHSLVKNRDIPENSIVFGQDKSIVIKQYKHEEMLEHMRCF